MIIIMIYLSCFHLNKITTLSNDITKKLWRIWNNIVLHVVEEVARMMHWALKKNMINRMLTSIRIRMLCWSTVPLLASLPNYIPEQLMNTKTMLQNILQLRCTIAQEWIAFWNAFVIIHQQCLGNINWQLDTPIPWLLGRIEKTCVKVLQKRNKPFIKVSQHTWKGGN